MRFGAEWWTGFGLVFAIRPTVIAPGSLVRRHQGRSRMRLRRKSMQMRTFGGTSAPAL